MIDRAPQQNDIRRVMDACLPGLENKLDFENNVLRQARGEVKVKKKLSVGFALIIVLVLAAVTALAAAILWEQHVIPLKEIEQTEGDYINWSLRQKQVLIRALIDSGSISESAETTRLFDDSISETEKQSIADQLVLTLTGQTDVNEISIDIITYAIMGATDTWTAEQRVWWQQVTNQFHGNQDAPDILIMPDGSEPTEAEAIAIAKAAILAAYKLPSDALDSAVPVANLYVTDERPDYRRWDIQFKFFKEGTDNWLERVLYTVVDQNGEVIADPDVSIPSLEEMAKSYEVNQALDRSSIVQAYRKYAEQGNNAAFQSWPLTLKAAYSQDMRSNVQAALASGDMNAYEDAEPAEKAIIASTFYAYGLPAQGDLSEADALRRAEAELLSRYGHQGEDFLFVFTFFDVTDPDFSLWRFIFMPANDLNAKITDHYIIELNARTGETVAAEAVQPRQLLETLDYDLTLH